MEAVIPEIFQGKKSVYIRRRTCPVCHKKYILYNAKEWAYKAWKKKGTSRNLIYFCSWTCVRKYEKENPDKRCKKQKMP